MQEEEPQPWYRSFFGREYLDIYAARFEPEQDAREAAFAASALGLKRGDEVLDLCCGQGRHAIPLARLGFRVAGLDLNKEYLAMLRAVALEQRVIMETINADMRMIPIERRFDAVVNFFSSFGYLESEDEDLVVLKRVRVTLKPGGGLLLDLINREWTLLNYQPNDWHRGEDGTIYLEHRDFDLQTGRNHVTFTSISPDGVQRDLGGHHIRLYTLAEVVKMLQAAGLEFETAYGGYQGEPYFYDSPRMIVVARKPHAAPATNDTES